MTVSELFLSRVFFQLFDPSASLGEGAAVDVGAMLAHEQRLAAGVGVDTHQRMGMRRCLGDFLGGWLDPFVLAGKLPGMDDPDTVERALFSVGQGVVGGGHIGEAGVAAIRRHRHRMQDRCERRLGTERFIGVPASGFDLTGGFFVLPEVGHDMNQRIDLATIA